MSRRTKKQPLKKEAKESLGGLSSISEADIIDLNELLLGKREINSTLAELEKLLQADKQADEDNFQLSLLGLLFNLCGVASKAVQLNLRRLSQSIERVFEELYENPKLIKPTAELPLFGSNNASYKKLFLRLEEFWEGLLSDRTNLLVDSKLLSYLYEALAMFCSSKIRTLRAVAAEVANSLVTAIIRSNVVADGGEKGRQAKKFVYDLYHRVLKGRLRDIDLSIRKRFLHCLTTILGGLSREFLTVGELEEVFLNFLTDRTKDDRQIALASLQKLYEKKDLQLKTPLVAFGKEVLRRFETEIDHNKEMVSYEVVHFINSLLSFSESISVNNAANLFCRVVRTKPLRAVEQEASCIFYKSLFPTYRAQPTAETLAALKDREFLSVFIEIDDDLTRQDRELVYVHAIAYNKERFDIDELFIMAMEEKLEDEVVMNNEQLHNALTLLVAYMRFIWHYHEKEQEKTDGYRKNILFIFNKRVCAYSRDIFQQLLAKHPQLEWDYVRLYSLMDPSIPNSFENYLHMISGKLAIIFEATKDPSVMKEIATFFKRMQKDKVGLLVDSIDMERTVKEGEDIGLQRCTALVQQFYVPALMNVDCLEALVTCFDRYPSCRKSLLTIMYTGHMWMFREFMSNINEETLKMYLPYRDLYFRFMETQLGNPDLSNELKLVIYTSACNTYYSTLPNQVQQLIYCEVRAQLVVRLLQFLLTMSRIEAYDTIAQGLEQGVIKKSLEPGLLGLLLAVCSVSVELACSDNMLNLLRYLILNKRTKQYEPVLREMVEEEASNGSNGPFVFWRFFKSVILRCEEEQRSTIVDIMISSYFNKQTKRFHDILLKKMVLFMIELCDQAFTDQNPGLFEILQLLFKRTSRRYSKSTIAKFAMVFQSKLERQNEQFRKSGAVRALKDLLTKKTKVAVSTAKKRQQESDQKSSSASSAKSSSRSSSKSQESARSKMEVEDEESGGRSRSKSNRRALRKRTASNSRQRSASKSQHKSRPKRRAK